MPKRELENAIERAVILSSGPSLELSALATDAAFAPACPAAPPSEPARPSEPPPAARTASSALAVSADVMTLEQLERHHILRVLEASSWIIEGPRGAAELLKVRPSTIRSRMKKLGIVRAGAPR